MPLSKKSSHYVDLSLISKGMGRSVAKLKSLCGPTRQFACTGLAAMHVGDGIKQGGAWLTGANNGVIVNFLDFTFSVVVRLIATILRFCSIFVHGRLYVFVKFFGNFCKIFWKSL